MFKHRRNLVARKLTFYEITDINTKHSAIVRMKTDHSVRWGNKVFCSKIKGVVFLSWLCFDSIGLTFTTIDLFYLKGWLLYNRNEYTSIMDLHWVSIIVSDNQVYTFCTDHQRLQKTLNWQFVGQKLSRYCSNIHRLLWSHLHHP